MRSHAHLHLLALGILGACGGGSGQPPVDAAGDYTLSLTARTNACEFDNWTEGDTTTGVAMTITQEGGEAEATVGGLSAAFLDLVLGSHVFTGEVAGNDLTLELFGTRQLTRDGCPHVVNAVLDATLRGDVLEGRIDYTINGNGGPECEALEGCVSYQDFNGTRPPQ